MLEQVQRYCQMQVGSLTLIVVAHDLLLVSQHCGQVVVLDAGDIVEAGPTATVFGAPTHPVTASLLHGEAR